MYSTYPLSAYYILYLWVFTRATPSLHWVNFILQAFWNKILPPKALSIQIFILEACSMKFAHCRLWEALVKIHKYLYILAIVFTVLYILYLWVFTSATHSLHWVNFILQAFWNKILPAESFGWRSQSPIGEPLLIWLNHRLRP
jgi:hypothetical protein